MQHKSIPIDYSVFNEIAELEPIDQKLLLAARESSTKAYAPYSGYKVGAAVMMENGEIIAGNNQENAAYPSGLCAERTALFYASAQFPDIPVRTIAVSTRTNGPQSGMAKPCGACRQVIAEYEDLAGKPIKIILDSPDEIVVLNGIDSLLPFRFKKSDLER